MSTLRLATLGLGLAVLLAACSEPAVEPPAERLRFQNVQAETAYVGDEACASCHAEEYQGYQEHGMAQSFYRLTAANVVEDFSGVIVPHTASGFTYVAYREGERFVQEEYRLDAQGRKTHRLIRPIDYVVGSGSAARTYLTEEAGRLYELPLTWYTQANDGQGRWDFSPGYAETNARFDRTIPSRCMACHNGISAPVAFADGLYRSVAEGIECEQCHGPGSLHVEARLAESEAPDSVDYTIVNPAHLPLDLRLDVCQQCHTNGSVSMLREGEEPYGFRPSEALAEHVAIFALVSDDPKRISVISHAQRMQQSPCFIESGVMDCTTCHNPHEGFREAGPSYFNETCQTCHTTPTLQQAMPTPELQAQHSIEANCFACHMPKVEAEDAPHSSFTDHYIRVVRNDQIEGTATARGTAELAPYFTRDAEGQEARIYQGMAYIVYGRNEGGGDALRRGINLLSEALDARPEFGEAQFLLGFAHLQLSQAAQAVAPLEASVEVNPEIPERLNALAQAYEQTGRALGQIEALYRQALAIQPVAASIRVNLGRFLDAQGRVQEALAEYRQAVQDEPFLATAHYNLGTAFLRLGDVDDGEDALREAVHLNPDHADALTNLGVLAGSRGNAREALDFFKRAVEAEPRNANALANLALAYAQLGDTNQARLYAQEALSVEPGHPTAQQVLTAL